MKTFTVTVAYYDSWNEQTFVVEAENMDDACAKAVELGDGDYATGFNQRSWGPGPTFVAGIEELGDLAYNETGIVPSHVIGGPVPFDHSEAAAIGGRRFRRSIQAAISKIELEICHMEGAAAERLRSAVAELEAALSSF